MSNDPFAGVLRPDRRPKRLTTRARHAIDAIANVLESDEIDASDRVALEDARAALDKYTDEVTR
ncbi:hypothetical protein ACFYL6_20705 [Micromonospora sp. NPDC007208]|uniref:hypothetical protein n=1 Tax=Micromonospora sp. NPDC007208 TaxID=3364236 RepID=UPI0036AD1299